MTLWDNFTKKWRMSIRTARQISALCWISAGDTTMGRMGIGPKHLPLARHLLTQTSDLDEARERVARVFCDHKLAYVYPKRRLNMRQHVVHFGNMALSYITYGCSNSSWPR